MVYLQSSVLFQSQSPMHSVLTAHGVFEHEVLTKREGILLSSWLGKHQRSLLLLNIDKIKPYLEGDREKFTLPKFSIAKIIHRRWYMNHIWAWNIGGIMLIREKELLWKICVLVRIYPPQILHILSQKQDFEDLGTWLLAYRHLFSCTLAYLASL